MPAALKHHRVRRIVVSLMLHWGSEGNMLLPTVSASLPEETEINEKREDILGRRAELLQQMKSCREQLKIQRKQQVKESEAACHRNATLLQDLQKIEDRLGGRQLPNPSLLALETRYWASVEESIPAWEHFLLGKGPHPAPYPEQPPRRARQRRSNAKDQGLPPLPKPRTAR